eukprot:TRINITY_DN76105_c0_g1_i1.p1 TRINITY_DN76105_c0_g1~~TRINITY_DN76105_c0_g1_i1.p1  ORF type:complete len:172 (-),score=16.02 TRINITY_DN76105_c0_g1_i1:4-519(-)
MAVVPAHGIRWRAAGSKPHQGARRSLLAAAIAACFLGAFHWPTPTFTRVALSASRLPDARSTSLSGASRGHILRRCRAPETADQSNNTTAAVAAAGSQANSTATSPDSEESTKASKKSDEDEGSQLLADVSVVVIVGFLLWLLVQIQLAPDPPDLDAPPDLPEVGLSNAST